MESEQKQIKLVRLERATPLPFSPADKQKLETLISRIPSNLRGVFGVMIPAGDNQNKPVLLGMVVQADPVLKALGTLYAHSSNKAQHSHDMRYHGDSQLLKIEGEKFAHFFESEPTPEAARGKHAAAIKTASNLRNGMTSSVTSIALDGAKNQPLTTKDAARIKKWAGIIPENIQGFFVCDLRPSEKNPQKLEIKQIAVDPVSAMKIIGAYTETTRGHPSSTHIIGRQDFKNISKTLPSPGRTKD